MALWKLETDICFLAKVLFFSILENNESCQIQMMGCQYFFLLKLIKTHRSMYVTGKTDIHINNQIQGNGRLNYDPINPVVFLYEFFGLKMASIVC